MGNPGPLRKVFVTAVLPVVQLGQQLSVHKHVKLAFSTTEVAEYTLNFHVYLTVTVHHPILPNLPVLN